MGNVRVLIQKTHPAEEIIPVVDHGIGIPNGEERQFLRSRVGHVCGNREELLKEEKHAECRSRHLPLKNEKCSQRKRDAQLHQRATRHHQEFTAEKPEQQMPALMDGYENKVDHQKWTTPARSLQEEERIERTPEAQHGQRDGLPRLLDRQKEWQTVGQRFRQLHATLFKTLALNSVRRFAFQTALRNLD